MKILFVLNAYGPISGAEHVLFDILRSAPEIEPILLQIGPKKNDLSEYANIISKNHCYYTFTNAPLLSAVSRQWLMGAQRNILCAILKKNSTISRLRHDESIDLVYYNNSFEAAAFYPLFKNKKSLVHVHDMVDMFRRAHKQCVLSACKRAGYVLTASEACRQMLIKNGVDAQKTTTAYNGISLPEVEFKEKEISEYVVGFVGSAIKRKGLDIYIATLNGMKKLDYFREKKLASVIITNSKRDSRFLMECLSELDAGIETQIFSGIPREAVYEQYKNMSMLLVPSRFDPLPTVVLEALMLGVPVMGSDKDGIPEMLPDKDLLFKVGDSVDAVSKIKKWLVLPYEVQKQKMDVAQKHIKNTFTKKNKKETVLKGIKEAVNR